MNYSGFKRKTIFISFSLQLAIFLQVGGEQPSGKADSFY